MVKKLTDETVIKFMSDVTLDKAFYVHNGPVIKNLPELKEYLSKMDEETYNYHRNATKNDFYNWILFVVGDIRLANEVARAKTKDTTLKKVSERVLMLKKIIEKK